LQLGLQLGWSWASEVKMLQRNDMLTTGDNRQQRQRGTVTVSKPSFGFFIAGSSINSMNGAYVRANAPDRDPLPGQGEPALYYRNDDGPWTMVLAELPAERMPPEDVDDEEDTWQAMYRRHHRPRVTHEWVFRDDRGVDRFSHEGACA
jgi:hypothetical protein